MTTATEFSPEVAFPAGFPALDCAKCAGSGRFIGRNGRDLGECFACKGLGLKFETPKPEAVAVDTTQLEAAFERARASGLKRLRITMGGMTIKPAGASSRNPGALYVTEGGEYLGKIMRGAFERVRSCPDDAAGRIATLLADPKRAAEAYGIQTGHCCICGLELTDPESIARGIGPICADRFGWV